MHVTTINTCTFAEINVLYFAQKFLILFVLPYILSPREGGADDLSPIFNISLKFIFNVVFGCM